MGETEVRYVCTDTDCDAHCSFCTSFAEHDISDSFVEVTCPRGFNIKLVCVADYSNFAVGDVYLDITDDDYYEVENVLDNCIVLHKWDNPDVVKEVHNTNTLVKKEKRPLCRDELISLIGTVVYDREDHSYALVTGSGSNDDGYYIVVDGVKYYADDLMEQYLVRENRTPLYKIKED